MILILRFFMGWAQSQSLFKVIHPIAPITLPNFRREWKIDVIYLRSLVLDFYIRSNWVGHTTPPPPVWLSAEFAKYDPSVRSRILPSRRKTLNKCLLNVGPPSKTVDLR